MPYDARSIAPSSPGIMPLVFLAVAIGLLAAVACCLGFFVLTHPMADVPEGSGYETFELCGR